MMDKTRIRTHGEVFTPKKYVNEMLDLVENFNFYAEDAVFLEPSCGSGNFVVELVERRLKDYHNSGKFQAYARPHMAAIYCTVENLWAIDIDEKNVELCKQRVWKVIINFFQKHNRINFDNDLGKRHKHKRELSYFYSVIKKQIRVGEFFTEMDKSGNLFQQLKHERANGKHLIAIGNPPFQKEDGGYARSAKPVYNLFFDTLVNSELFGDILLITPARWFAGGKGLDKFRKRMLSCGRIKSIKYFENSKEVFPTVDIGGGVCFLVWAKNHSGKTKFIDKEKTYEIYLSQFDIIPSDIGSIDIIKKIQNKWEGQYVGDIAWSRKPFGLESFYFDRNKGALSDCPNSIKCYTIRRKIQYIDRNIIEKNANEIDKWKVAYPKAYSNGSDISAPPIFLIESGAICTETYSIIDSFKTKSEANNPIKYLQTNFSRYLLGLRKITQNISRDSWNWVPYMGVSKEWTDKELFEFFDITKSEQQHIKKKVQEWNPK